jgi:hypothetical protein
MSCTGCLLLAAGKLTRTLSGLGGYTKLRQKCERSGCMHFLHTVIENERLTPH